jgi:4-hydroxy-tetrahydrodipicolinate reductase
MLNIIISGCNGHMGRTVASLAAGDHELTIAAGFDIDVGVKRGFPVFTDPEEFTGDCDVVIDFSSPSALPGLLAFCVSKSIPAVLCTTGYSEPQLKSIGEVSTVIPIFRSANMSTGINLLADLVRRACAVLGGSYDVEIIERHHRHKADAPSGTALMLADAAASALPYKAECVFERSSVRQPRGKCEIGISSVRGGSIVGEHEVVLAGFAETIELRHSVSSRDVFADGALKAAKFIAGVGGAGLYDMNDMLAALR